MLEYLFMYRIGSDKIMWKEHYLIGFQPSTCLLRNARKIPRWNAWLDGWIRILPLVAVSLMPTGNLLPGLLFCPPLVLNRGMRERGWMALPLLILLIDSQLRGGDRVSKGPVA